MMIALALLWLHPVRFKKTPLGGSARKKAYRGTVPVYGALPEDTGHPPPSPNDSSAGQSVPAVASRVGPPLAIGCFVAAGLASTDLSVLASNPLVRDSACSIVAVVGAVGWLKVWTSLAASGAMDSRLSRKIIHCGSGPLFLLVWPLYSLEPNARLVAALVPALNMARLVAAGTKRDSSDIVTAVSRSGDAKEVLGGPLLYCAVLLAATLFGWRGSSAAVVAIAQMAIGDGVADIVGRRFGKRHKWPFAPSKSYAGSIAFAFAATLASFALLRWFQIAGCLALPFETTDLLARLFLISVLCAFTELVPAADDNISVPLVAAILATTLLR
ncbi:hypothetical protein CTAYLR_007105 [Chrysophaeum taylorii]|uniref:phytol kinase n=1 Tax=Chrysophaeum taylorii TaxID=2483200 RepID=A0AAD7UKB3_9STRA|nr:hypothetical protein CTAYLR_007105 [Chrysophaeum taylorii]